MKQWQDLGNDRWKLTILPDDPDDTTTPPSVYRGTKAEIAEMLADSQGHANQRITELKRGTGNGTAKAQPVPPLTAEQRMLTVAELNNPATVDKAIKRVVESEMGETMEERRARQQQEDHAREEHEQVQAALRFANSTPEWFDSVHNQETLVRFMVAQGYDLKNTSHYTMAFERLTAAQLLQSKPAGAEPQLELEEEETSGQRNAPVPVPVPRAPNRVSTGVTQRDISGLPPRPTTRLKYTREQIRDLSAYDYKRLMLEDPEFTRCVEYYAQLDRQRRRVS